MGTCIRDMDAQKISTNIFPTTHLQTFSVILRTPPQLQSFAQFTVVKFLSPSLVGDAQDWVYHLGGNWRGGAIQLEGRCWVGVRGAQYQRTLLNIKVSTKAWNRERALYPCSTKKGGIQLSISCLCIMGEEHKVKDAEKTHAKPPGQTKLVG